MKQEFQSSPNSKDNLIRSFGRIKSRKLSDHKNFLLTNLFPQYELQNPSPISNSDSHLKSVHCASSAHVCSNTLRPGSHEQTSSDLSEARFGIGSNNSISTGSQKTILEIGFGFGDFLFAKAQSTPNQMFLGCEPHINGVVNVLAKLEKEALNNIKISRIDAREMLQKFPDNFFDEIYILFPDPWPKAKHFKRRLLNLEFLDFIATKLKKQGKLIIATDHDSYKTWILSAILKCNSLKWQASSKQDWQVFPDNWIETKYQKKAAVEGRVSVIFNLKKAN